MVRLISGADAAIDEPEGYFAGYSGSSLIKEIQRHTKIAERNTGTDFKA
jgi:hypothetical protein